MEDDLFKKDKNELLLMISVLKKTIREQEEKIKLLLEQIHLFRSRKFGSKSEKILEAGQFDEPSEPKNIEEIKKADEEISVAAHKRKKSNQAGRKPIPETLERKQIIYDLSEEEKQCSCGCVLTPIGTKITEQLEIIPAKLFVIQHVRNKYACKGCEQTVKKAKMPLQPIFKSIAGPGLLAHTLVAKYEDHLPLYRQEHIYNRIGIDLPRATLSYWVIKTAELLKPLYDLMLLNINNYDVAYCDETTTQVLKEPGKKAQSKSYMWALGGGDDEKFCYYYHYAPGRNQEVLLELLPTFTGYLHSDGYSAYDSFASKNERSIIQVGCWYHCRRKFLEASKVSNKPGVASKVIEYIQVLSEIEKNCKESKLCFEDIYKARQEKAVPVFQELKNYLEEHKNKVLPKSLLATAIFYALNQWNKLINYTRDGRLEISNNRMERIMKPFATGRKNWLFSNSVSGAQAGSIILSLIETCSHHKIEAYDWLRFVLKNIRLYEPEKIFELLPYNIDKSLLEISDDEYNFEK